MTLTVLAWQAPSHGASPPGTVAGLQVSPVTLSRLDLRWEPVPGAERYKVYRGMSQDFVPSDETWIACAAANSYPNRELSPSTTYWYRVAAVRGEQEGEASPAVAGTTRHKDLALVSQGTRHVVQGDAFQITWDQSRGGEITQIRQYDGLNWISLLSAPGPGHYDTVPRYAIQDRAGGIYYLSQSAESSWEPIKATPDEIAFVFRSSPRTDEGKISPWTIRQTYRVFKEGVLFCDLEISRVGVAPGPGPDVEEIPLGLLYPQQLAAGHGEIGFR